MTLPSIAKLASKHDIRPLKKLGQNFIYDESLCDKIVAESGLTHGDIAIEIGPGPAGLTRSILKKNPGQLIAIEMDQRCRPLLQELQDIYPNFSVIYSDAKKISIKSIVDQYNPANKHHNRLRIIANLPYNVGTILLMNWLKEIDVICSMTIMLQREVVDRITANTNTSSYGRLSVICQLICDAKKCFDVSPKAFYPPPSIWSSIVHLTPKPEIPHRDLLTKVEYITNMAFSGRRKKIKTSLGKLIQDTKVKHETIEELLDACQIDPNMRAENLSPQDYLKIANLLCV